MSPGNKTEQLQEGGCYSHGRRQNSLTRWSRVVYMTIVRIAYMRAKAIVTTVVWYSAILATVGSV